MPLLIKTTGLDEYLDPTGEAFIKMLVMGEPGAGKTPSAAQWPKPIFAMCETGLASIARNKVPYADIKSSKDMEDLLDHLRRDTLLPKEKRKYQTFVLDTIDTYQRVLISERLKTEKKETISGWADWGWLDAKMVQLVEALVNLRMNVIINMHVKDVSEGDDDTRMLVKKAKLKGDIKDSIWQDFDLIGLMEKTYVMEAGQRVQKRHIRWHSEPKFPNLRDRFNVLPRFTDVDFTPNDYQQIFDAIANSLDEIPASAVAESIDQGATEPEPAKDLEGGPVSKPDLPRTAAKKAAPAKKTAAKKTAAPAPEAATPVEETKDEGSPAAPAEPAPEADAAAAEQAAEEAAVAANAVKDPWAPPEVNGKGTAEEPVIIPGTTAMAAESKIKDACDHVHAEDGTCLKNAFGEPCHLAGLGAKTISEEKAPEPTPEPAKAAPAAKAANVRHCGDQPASMTKFPAAPGCGVELNGTNAARQQIAMLKKKTFLCDQCHDAANAA